MKTEQGYTSPHTFWVEYDRVDAVEMMHIFNSAINGKKVSGDLQAAAEMFLLSMEMGLNKIDADESEERRVRLMGEE